MTCGQCHDTGWVEPAAAFGEYTVCLNCGLQPVRTAAEVDVHTARTWLGHHRADGGYPQHLMPVVESRLLDAWALAAVPEQREMILATMPGMIGAARLWLDYGDLGRELLHGIATDKPDPRVTEERGLRQLSRSMTTSSPVACDVCGTPSPVRTIAEVEECPQCGSTGTFQGLSVLDVCDVYWDEMQGE